MPLLKVCGITRVEDAVTACELGYDAVGMVFAPGPRCLSPDGARAISRALRASTLRVGVVVNLERGEVRRLVEYCALDLVQFHGEESPEDVKPFGARAIVALRPQGPEELARIEDYPGVFAVLIDAWDPAMRGGTGKTCDWSLAARAAQQTRVILAGGLNPANVRQAVEKVYPFGVDVCSGVEMEPGGKDPVLMRDFALAARSALRAVEQEDRRAET
ncbi:MAG: phosphoribosylanthranilate isomerase [Actinobacteria bacterium]|jgi:phosphoribosylanthranilate isomerase|nr:MAG: phosphoribosylanthranilate isomerase [Actinomycetota bacterium]